MNFGQFFFKTRLYPISIKANGNSEVLFTEEVKGPEKSTTLHRVGSDIPRKKSFGLNSK